MVLEKNKVFNLMDTNGRRNDVINALQGYLNILDDLINKKNMIWGKLPQSFVQFEFYKRAIELSPDIFEEHKPYDFVCQEIENNKELKLAIENRDLLWFKNNLKKGTKLADKIDNGIEDRTRHYTSNLVKLGLTDKKRTNLTAVGKSVLNNNIVKDELESILPLKPINLLYMRQLLKLRIFDEDGKMFYSPFALALYLLLKYDRISIDIFNEIIQSGTPYKDYSNIDKYFEEYEEGQIVNEYEVQCNFNKTELSSDEFSKKFKNRKSGSTIDDYYEFYKVFYKLSKSKKQEDLNALLEIYEQDGVQKKIKKAFGYGKNLFDIRKGQRPEVKDFISEYSEYFGDNINNILYEKFEKSKYLDLVQEYADTTNRIFKATGLISFDSGFVEILNKEFFKIILKETTIKDLISGNIEKEKSNFYSDINNYENNFDSYFCTNISLIEMLKYSEENIIDIERKIKNKFNGATIESISKQLSDNRRKEFENFIEEHYPEDEIKHILSLFSNRNNDKIIKDIVSKDASVPTIYEYIVGIAWYYFSNKTMNLLESLNLTLSADFEPLLHAGGGQGDIVVYHKDKVVMLEATLMNASSQKRGEWEPVLRHSVNLKVEEETKMTERKVITFFISDEFDWNTINIWKAVASVPLQSSLDKNKTTNNVVIMPVNNMELCSLIDKKEEYNEIINNVLKLFKVEPNFDFHWRDNFMKNVL